MKPDRVSAIETGRRYCPSEVGQYSFRWISGWYPDIGFLISEIIPVFTLGWIAVWYYSS
jgi:hypothetical protein